MAATKKTTIAEAKTTDTKTEEIKTTPAESVAEPKKAARKTTAKKAPAKKTAAAKKETVKKETPAKKTAAKETIQLQFADQTYTTEELVKIAKDVWKYDLKQKVGDFKTVELYVKPEERVVYYVVNGDITGSFGI